MKDLLKSALVRRVLLVIGALILIPVVGIGTLAVTSGSADPPSPFFGGGSLTGGELVTGPEPDWSFLGDVGTVDLQLLDPPRSRVIWIADYDGKAYVVSGYMGSFIGRLVETVAGAGGAGRSGRGSHPGEALRAHARSHPVGSGRSGGSQRRAGPQVRRGRPGRHRVGGHVALRARSPRLGNDRRVAVRLLSWTLGLVVAVILTVLLVPGLAASIEGTLLGWMAGWSS